MTSTLKLPIHFVQQHVRQQRRQRAALRRPAAAFLDHAIDQRSRIQIGANQPDNRLIRNPFAQTIHQDVVIDPVEELLQINIHHHFTS
ncbi:hypothetical protein D3C86_1609890 [compost metagenome]